MKGMYQMAALGCCAWWSASALAQSCQPNLLANPGFEEGLSGWRAQGAQADGDAHSGRGSLRYDNADAAQYRTFSQMLRVAPGQTIDFGVWLKTHGVRGQSRDGGAGVYLQSFDAQGRFLEGSYPAGVTGDSGWRQVSASYTVPPQAARVTLASICARGAPVPPGLTTPMRVLERLRRRCISSARRRRGRSTRCWSLRSRSVCRSTANCSMPRGRLFTVAATVIRLKGSAVSNTHCRPAWPRGIPPAPAGHRAAIPAGTGQRAVFSRRAACGQSGDRQRRLYPARWSTAFPLGIYANVATDEHLARIASAGFNTVLNYDYGEKKDPYAFSATHASAGCWLFTPSKISTAAAASRRPRAVVTTRR